MCIFIGNSWHVETVVLLSHKKPDGHINVKVEFGEGECACMAMARYGQETIASSNFRDVAPYCDANDIEYIGVIDRKSTRLNSSH